MKTNLYLATAEGLATITGSNGDWRGKVSLAGTQLQCVAVGRSPGDVYCGTFGQGILSSTDGGVSWSSSSSLGTARVTALAVSKDGSLYAGTEPSSVYRSGDEGETWHELSSLLTLRSSPTWSFPPRPDTHHIQAILPNADLPGRLLVAVEAGALLRSDDDGKTWHDRTPGGPMDTHTLSASSGDSLRIFSAAGDGCFESTNGGNSWQPIVNGLKHTYCWSIALDTEDSETMLLSASEHAFTAHDKQIARSFIYRRVGNEPWRLAMSGLATLPQSRVPVLVAAPLETGGFYLAADGVVYRSIDSGLRWEQLPVRWDSDKPMSRHSLNIAISQERV